MKHFALLATTLAVLSCGGSEPSVTDSEPVAVESGTAMLQIEVEIGVELGDSNFVFGITQDVDFTPDGNVAILDAQRKKVKLFSPAGDFLGEFGGEGEAPGEFLHPRGIACLNDGRIAVTDPFSREIEVFGSDLQYLETVSDFAARAPFVITAAGNGFAGEQMGLNRNTGIATISVVLWDHNPDSAQVFSEIENSFSPDEVIQRVMQPTAGLTADSINLYYSAPLSEEYVVSVYPMDSSEPYNLTYPDYSPVEKTAEDIEEDLLAYEYRMQGMASTGRGRRLAGATYEPPPDYYATSSLGVDSQGNIWVQRGWETNPTFDLFPPGATEPAETVIADPELNLSSYTFVITQNGFAAFDSNPEDYPRVLLLHLSGQ
ncbi:MAG: hypothetical protein K8S62_08235 [Candidatus Sabulitectum sp.]|nr:hypothetical protein [Candidatus Sabulitectum sp.]